MPLSDQTADASLVARLAGATSDGEWRTFAAWVECAARDLNGHNALCLDAKDRVCRRVDDFARARDEGAFPVRFYRSVGTDTKREQDRARRAAEKHRLAWG